MTHSKRHQAFINSDYFKEARKRGLQKALAKRANGPKCGAKKRTDGQPCQQPVSEEGLRCRYHGGATPKGKEWHRCQWPKKGAASSRLKVKQVSLAIRDRKLKERIAEMTSEELEQYEIRRRAKRPGTPAERKQARDGRQAKKMIDDLQKDEKPISDEINALEAQIRNLEDRANQLRLDQYDEDELPEVFK